MTATPTSDLAAFLDLGGLPAQVAQVVQLGPADVAAGHDLDLLEDRRVEREGPLDTHAEGDLADREGAADAGALEADHDALEDLDARARALGDLDVDLDGVAGAELGKVVALGGVAQLGDGADVVDGHVSPHECHRSAVVGKVSAVEAQSVWPAAPRSPCGRRRCGPLDVSAGRSLFGRTGRRAILPDITRLGEIVPPGDDRMTLASVRGRAASLGQDHGARWPGGGTLKAVAGLLVH